ncbi:MAG: helix-turn-helix domain-containing protein, partial [Dongiaceae bacterium]
MPRAKKAQKRSVRSQALGNFIKSVREAQGHSLVDVARNSTVNRQALYSLEGRRGVPSLRTMDAVCQQIGLDPLLAIGAGYGEGDTKMAGPRHHAVTILESISGEDLDLAVELLQAGWLPPAPGIEVIGVHELLSGLVAVAGLPDMAAKIARGQFQAAAG